MTNAAWGGKAHVRMKRQDFRGWTNFHDMRLPYKNYIPKWHYQGSFDRNGLLRSLFNENLEGRKSVGGSTIELEHWKTFFR